MPYTMRWLCGWSCPSVNSYRRAETTPGTLRTSGMCTESYQCLNSFSRASSMGLTNTIISFSSSTVPPRMRDSQPPTSSPDAEGGSKRMHHSHGGQGHLPPPRTGPHPVVVGPRAHTGPRVALVKELTLVRDVRDVRGVRHRCRRHD